MAVRAARIVDGLVVNVIMVEALPAPEIEALAEGDLIECPEEVGIDWTYDLTKTPNPWTAPPVVPLYGGLDGV